MLYDPNWSPPDIKLEPWQEIIHHAIELIETHGWVQKSFGNRFIGFCLVGAISAAWQAKRADENHLSTMDRSAYMMVFDRANKVFNNIGIGIADWNDKTGRTKEEVIAKLKEIADAV
jgi:hypothetical protein